MKRSRILPWIFPAATLILACSDDSNTPGLHSISGHVKLTGYLVSPSGQFAGTKVVGDADGVRVELLYGSQVVAQTTTVDGVYRFSGLGPGGYRARSQVFGNVGDQTTILTITQGDVRSGDTLRLVSAGDLVPIPNPMVSETIVYFTIPDSQHVNLGILDPDGHRIRTLLDAGRNAGVNQARWDGLDQNGNPAPGALYWVTFETAGPVRHAHLLFK